MLFGSSIKPETALPELVEHFDGLSALLTFGLENSIALKARLGR